jgi:hypothetical protein
VPDGADRDTPGGEFRVGGFDVGDGQVGGAGEPGGGSVRPTPIWIEQAEPEGVSCTTRNWLAGVVNVEVEPGLAGIERQRLVDVADRDGDDLEFVVH